MRAFHWTLSALIVMGLTLGFSTAKAADAAAGTSITGQVLDKDGNGVPNATVNLFNAQPKGEKHGDKPGGGDAKHEPKPQAEGGKPKGGGDGAAHAKPAAVATTTSDAQGNFHFDNVAAGDYVINAFVKEVGMGYEHAHKADGADTAVKVTLKAKGQGHEKPKGGDSK